MNTKAILASSLFTALLIGASANANMVGDLTDYVDNSASVELQKVSVELSAPSYTQQVNR